MRKYYPMQTNMTLEDARRAKVKTPRAKPMKRMAVRGKPCDEHIRWAAKYQPLLLMEWLERAKAVQS